MAQRLWTWPAAPGWARIDNARCMEVARLTGTVGISVEWSNELAVGRAMEVVHQLRLEGCKDAQLCLHLSPGHHTGPQADVLARVKDVSEWIQAYNPGGYQDPVGAVFLDAESAKFGDDWPRNIETLRQHEQYVLQTVEGLKPFAAPITWYGRGITSSSFGNRWVRTGWHSFIEPGQPRVFSCSWYEPYSSDRCRDLIAANMQFASMLTADQYALQLWVSLASAYVETLTSKRWTDPWDGGQLVDNTLKKVGEQLRGPWYWNKPNYVNGSKITDVIIYPGPDKGDVWMRQLKAFVGK